MPHDKRAFDALNDSTQEIKRTIGISQSMLYIGWRHDCHRWWHSKFCHELEIKNVTILEIFKPNHDDAVTKLNNGHFGDLNVDVVLGDARKAVEVLDGRTYDVVFWDHGPEHVNSDDLTAATHGLQRIADKLLLYCCPWGEWPQDPTDGNESERHYTVEAEQLESMGFDVIRTGNKGVTGGGELVAMKFMVAR